jgi:flagellar motor switch protein FliN
MSNVKNVDQILKLEVPIVVRLGERMMSVSDVVTLLPGAIIELAKEAEDELDLLVNNKQIATGTAVKVGENFGLRITFIGDAKERILAMGQDKAASAAASSSAPEADAAMLAEAMLAGQV